LALQLQVLLLETAVRDRLGEFDLLPRADLRQFAFDADGVARSCLELFPQFCIDDEHLGDLDDVQVDAPARLALAALDYLTQRRRDGVGQGRLALFNALIHGQVSDDGTQFAEADVAEKGLELLVPVAAGEVEAAGRRFGIGDAVNDDALEAQRDAVLALLCHLERRLLLRAGDQDERRPRPEESAGGETAIGDLAAPADNQELIGIGLDEWHGTDLLSGTGKSEGG